ncbi:MraY family glycosyltransferase [Streptomyces xanthii]|uniref:Undecaprenyl/decaprenyl-phosphate alpha-N-acetylglucosaminyl 1-phosphate transferase n=1 Tax=Streptomyces xanthii TaxID=2768069 RepID=A0A7H1B9K7_9ACTN|nr:undecaprenyl/decaprenyl-phosphate alpha-N-acetylglucosaminyl 1-phosphate transferase [Streptomyces xanthii]QNS05412.1 undecaprenyl/decaprenyl-phosphate alpha-N-acetylglucosaminyl 1-phosphate transferase [Streptomyces xanthii]
MLYGTAAASAALLLTTLLTAALRPLALGRRRRRGVALRGAPRVGGLALLTVTGAVAAAGALTGAVPLDPATTALLTGATVVGLLGLADGLRPGGLDARVRIAAEAAAATVVVHLAGLGLLTGALAVLWIVFVTHAFRQLDTSEGVMGTVGVVTALGLCVCAGAEGLGALAVLLALLAAALTGHLMHAWHPARARAGGCGALYTGFLVAGAALLVNAEHTAPEPAASMFALTALPAADAVLALVTRRRARRPAHLAHRLRRLGLTAPGAAVALGVATALTTVVGVLLHRGALGPEAVWWPAAALALAVLLALRDTKASEAVRTEGVRT